MRARNKFLLSAVMMTLLSSTMAMPSTWAAAGLNSDGRVFAVGSESKFESTGYGDCHGAVVTSITPPSTWMELLFSMPVMKAGWR